MIRDTPSSLSECQPILLSFSMTRLQRIVNPTERIIFAFSALLGLVVMLIIPLQAIKVPVVWLAATACIAVLYLLFRRPLTSLYLAITHDEYINIVEIRKNDIRLGVGKPDLTISRGACSVGQGFFGVSVLRTSFGQSIVIPQSSIPTSELKNLFNNNNTKRGFIEAIRLLADRDKKIKNK